MQVLLAALASSCADLSRPRIRSSFARVPRWLLEPWITHRQQQGHRLHWSPTCCRPTRSATRSAARPGPAGCGTWCWWATPTRRPRWTRTSRRCVPTHLVPAQINVRWGSEPEIATDNRYADLDDDGVPDVAVGRLPADTPDELDVLSARSCVRTATMRALAAADPRRGGPGRFGTLTDSCSNWPPRSC